MPKSSSITRGAVRPAFGSQIIWSGSYDAAIINIVDPRNIIV
jgi:hypothetical protein